MADVGFYLEFRQVSRFLCESCFPKKKFAMEFSGWSRTLSRPTASVP